MGPPPDPERSSARGAVAVVVAAGSSSRMRGAAPGPRKPLLELEGRSILEHACAALGACARVEDIVVVAHAEDVESVERLALERVRAVVPGGPERVDSVRLGLAAYPGSAPLAAIHDAARACVSPEAITRVIERADATRAAILAVPVTDTLKHSEDGQKIDHTVGRGKLWAAQTPQVFERRPLADLYHRARAEGFHPTDDAALWERYVGPVALVEGEPTNLKITRPEDLELAALILRRRSRSVTS